jgi:hypothetical protein
VSGASSIAIRNRSSDRGDAVAWQWKRGAATAKENFGDPLGSGWLGLCLYDKAGGLPALVRALDIPPGDTCGGKPCWKDLPTGYKYGDRLLASDGVQRVVLKAGVDGKAAIAVRAKGRLLAPPHLPLTKDPQVVVQLQARGGPCWEAAYDTAARNDATKFRAKSN